MRSWIIPLSIYYRDCWGCQAQQSTVIRVIIISLIISLVDQGYLDYIFTCNFYTIDISTSVFYIIFTISLGLAYSIYIWTSTEQNQIKLFLPDICLSRDFPVIRSVLKFYYIHLISTASMQSVTLNAFLVKVMNFQRKCILYKRCWTICLSKLKVMSHFIMKATLSLMLAKVIHF